MKSWGRWLRWQPLEDHSHNSLIPVPISCNIHRLPIIVSWPMKLLSYGKSKYIARYWHVQSLVFHSRGSGPLAVAPTTTSPMSPWFQKNNIEILSPCLLFLVLLLILLAIWLAILAGLWVPYSCSRKYATLSRYIIVHKSRRSSLLNILASTLPAITLFCCLSSSILAPVLGQS